MAKDYFQDILPPDNGKSPASAEETPRSIPIRQADHPEPPIPHGGEETPEDVPERSIRNISMPARPPKRAFVDLREPPPPGMRSRSRFWIWGVAVLCVVVLGGLLLVAFRATTITITPRAQALTLDPATVLTAYPAATAATGTLSYTVQSADFEDSEVVSSSGTVHAEDKASGTITVYNNYQTSPLKFVATTRFQSADGHMFRTPNQIVIPGKKGSTPGQVTVTVIADQAGEAYNVAAGKFTVPGLKSSATEYAQVYAQSSVPMSGGFSGDKPGVSDSALAAAKQAMQGRLESKAQAATASTADSLVLPQLVRISYSDEPSTPEAGGNVRLHEKAHVDTPVFSQSALANILAPDVAGAPVTFTAGAGFAAAATGTAAILGKDSLKFTLAGQATITWTIDTTALTKALAGKDQSAFQSVVAQFPGIDQAKARIEPFWKGSFPTDPTKIKVILQQPTK